MLIKLRNNYSFIIFINTSTIIPLHIFAIHVTYQFKLTLNASLKLHTFIGNLKMFVHLVVCMGTTANCDIYIYSLYLSIYMVSEIQTPIV